MAPAYLFRIKKKKWEQSEENRSNFTETYMQEESVKLYVYKVVNFSWVMKALFNTGRNEWHHFSWRSPGKFEVVQIKMVGSRT